MIKVYETSIRFPRVSGTVNFFPTLANRVSAALGPNTRPLRFAVTRSDPSFFEVELGVLECENGGGDFDSIFRFNRRPIENTREFNAVLVVPTGIGAAIGGHAGDAGPVARLLSSMCDHLITHPNVVNASDINDMTENTLYMEGSVLCRLLMGTIGIQKVRSNRVLTVIEKHPTDPLFVNGAVNAVNAARASGSLDCRDILLLDPAMQLTAEYAQSGRAVGHVTGLETVLGELRTYQGQYDCIAFSSIIKIPSGALHKQYFDSKGEMINPWGGAEAIFTHAISSILSVPSAHSPMMENQLVANMDVGIVDARQAAEAVSFTYMQCILKGLQRAPRIVTDANAMRHHTVLTAADISCLVIPDHCVGLPTLAALEQGIPVIAVQENTNIMRNDLRSLPWAENQLHFVANYPEAVGVMAALRSGVPVSTIRRPIANARSSLNMLPRSYVGDDERTSSAA